MNRTFTRCQGNQLPDNNKQEKAKREAKQKEKKTKRRTNVDELTIMKTKNAASYFSVCITGQIISASFPLGPDRDYIFCRYELVAGPDWLQCAGQQQGLTQLATNKGGHFNDPIVINMPIEVTYKSTSAYGWPQIIVSVFGRNGWAGETLLGYAHLHLPVFGCQVNKKELLTAPILKIKCPNMLAELTNWLLRRSPELRDPKVLLDNIKCKGLSMESYGTLHFQFNTIMRDARKLGYNWNA